jgi:hypothetical protein
MTTWHAPLIGAPHFVQSNARSRLAVVHSSPCALPFPGHATICGRCAPPTAPRHGSPLSARNRALPTGRYQSSLDKTSGQAHKVPASLNPPESNGLKLADSGPLLNSPIYPRRDML